MVLDGILQAYFQLNGTPSDGGLMRLDDYSMDDTWNSPAYQNLIN
jgi:hypothetical protein